VVAEASDKAPELITANIDLEYLEQVRQRIPVWSHRREEIYGPIKTLSSAQENNTPSTNCS
jgi:predicted amidohydrolase